MKIQAVHSSEMQDDCYGTALCYIPECNSILCHRSPKRRSSVDVEWERRCCLRGKIIRLLLGRGLFRILFRTPTILIEVFRGISRSLLPNYRAEHRLGLDLFLSSTIHFIVHISPNHTGTNRILYFISSFSSYLHSPMTFYNPSLHDLQNVLSETEIIKY